MVSAVRWRRWWTINRRRQASWDKTDYERNRAILAFDYSFMRESTAKIKWFLVDEELPTLARIRIWPHWPNFLWVHPTENLSFVCFEGFWQEECTEDRAGNTAQTIFLLTVLGSSLSFGTVDKTWKSSVPLDMVMDTLEVSRISLFVCGLYGWTSNPQRKSSCMTSQKLADPSSSGFLCRETGMSTKTYILISDLESFLFVRKSDPPG